MDAHTGAEALGVEHPSSVDASSGDSISRISVDVEEEEEESTASPPPLSMGEANLVDADDSGADDSGATLFPAAEETGLLQYISRRLYLHPPAKKGGNALGRLWLITRPKPKCRKNKNEKEEELGNLHESKSISAGGLEEIPGEKLVKS